MGIDYKIDDVTVQDYIDTLQAAVNNLHTVQPAELRDPLCLWLRSCEERAIRGEWTSLTGRPVIAAWNAARAILDNPKDGA